MYVKIILQTNAQFCYPIGYKNGIRGFFKNGNCQQNN